MPGVQLECMQVCVQSSSYCKAGVHSANMISSDMYACSCSIGLGAGGQEVLYFSAAVVYPAQTLSLNVRL